ncbi:MAG: serine hydrolase domain-containing protein [Planctomycetota bacterium]
MKPLAFTALSLAVLPASAALAPQEEFDALVQRLTARAERAVSENAYDGLVVVVGVGDDVLMERGWGRFPGGALAEAASPLRAAPLSVLAALQLVDEGKIDLEAPVGKYLEGLEWEGTEVTVHHVLSHTSGLIGWSDAFRAKGDVGTDVKSLVGLVKELGVQSAPGECFAYSETNALLVAAIVEAVAQKPLAEVVQSGILAKAGAESSGFDVEGAPPAQEEAARSQEIDGDQIHVEPAAFPFGEDGFSASALDLFRIRRGLTARTLAGDAMIDAIKEPKRLNDGTQLGYGYGVSVGRLGSLEAITTGGSADGTTVHFAYYPEAELTVVVMVADQQAPLMALERDLSRIVMGMPLPGVQDLELDPSDAEAFLGRYQVGCTTYEVTLGSDAHLRVNVADRPVYRLLFQGRHSFVAQRDADVRFDFEVEDDRTKASRLVIDEHGRRTEAVRFQ